MVVVTVVAIMAAVAAPSVIRLIQDRKSQKDALSVLVVLQDAHTRAYGKGAAMIVTYLESAPRDRITIQESLTDINVDGTGDIPNPSCFGTPGPVTRFWQSEDQENQTNVELNMNGQFGANVVPAGPGQQLCFLPRGGTYMLDAGLVWRPLFDPITFSFLSSTSGVTRRVNLFPNGNSRLRL